MMPYQDCGPPRRILLLGSAERSVARSTEPQFIDFFSCIGALQTLAPLEIFVRWCPCKLSFEDATLCCRLCWRSGGCASMLSDVADPRSQTGIQGFMCAFIRLCRTHFEDATLCCRLCWRSMVDVRQCFQVSLILRSHTGFQGIMGASFWLCHDWCHCLLHLDIRIQGNFQIDSEARCVPVSKCAENLSTTGCGL